MIHFMGIERCLWLGTSKEQEILAMLWSLSSGVGEAAGLSLREG